VEAKGITIPDLESTIGTQELFAAQKMVIIDRLHSLPKSKHKDELIDWITAQKSESTHIVFVENKILTPTMLKKFPTAQVQLYKLPSLVFMFIDAIGTLPAAKLITMFHQILLTQDPEFVFTMIVRQVRILIAFVADGVYEGPPFGRSKIQRQSQAFSIERLLVLHHKLLDIDRRQKTSRASLSLAQEIDLLLTEA
jgi:DNA polymerase III delta subunit